MIMEIGVFGKILIGVGTAIGATVAGVAIHDKIVESRITTVEERREYEYKVTHRKEIFKAKVADRFIKTMEWIDDHKKVVSGMKLAISFGAAVLGLGLKIKGFVDSTKLIKKVKKIYDVVNNYPKDIVKETYKIASNTVHRDIWKDLYKAAAINGLNLPSDIRDGKEYMYLTVKDNVSGVESNFVPFFFSPDEVTA